MKKKQKVFPSHPQPPHVEDINVVQFKRKFHYIISGREFFTILKKKLDKIRIKSKSLMLRKGK